jgi:hypothetical protein
LNSARCRSDVRTDNTADFVREVVTSSLCEVGSASISRNPLETTEEASIPDQASSKPSTRRSQRRSNQSTMQRPNGNLFIDPSGVLVLREKEYADKDSIKCSVIEGNVLPHTSLARLLSFSRYYYRGRGDRFHEDFSSPLFEQKLNRKRPASSALEAAENWIPKQVVLQFSSDTNNKTSNVTTVGEHSRQSTVLDMQSDVANEIQNEDGSFPLLSQMSVISRSSSVSAEGNSTIFVRENESVAQCKDMHEVIHTHRSERMSSMSNKNTSGVLGDESYGRSFPFFSQNSMNSQLSEFEMASIEKSASFTQCDDMSRIPSLFGPMLSTSALLPASQAPFNDDDERYGRSLSQGTEETEIYSQD